MKILNTFNIKKKNIPYEKRSSKNRKKFIVIKYHRISSRIKVRNSKSKRLSKSSNKRHRNHNYNNKKQFQAVKKM